MSENGEIKAISLFAGGGIGELLLDSININVVFANEINPKRCEFYKGILGKDILCGDIQNKQIRELIQKAINRHKPKILIATPPCQGFSTAGKNKSQKSMINDSRNMLIFDTLDILNKGDFDYVLIENVPRFLSLKYYFDKQWIGINEILNNNYGDKYNIEYRVLNVKDYGVPQNRKRAVIRLYKKGLKWTWPKEEREITLREAIGHLPSIEAGEDSGIKWHVARKQNPRYIHTMKYTKEGNSALLNNTHYPKKENGDKISGFHNTFRRMSWNKPSWAITTNNGSIGSHNTVHPGRKRQDGTYSDARVLTPLELFILFSIPMDNKIPYDTSET